LEITGQVVPAIFTLSLGMAAVLAGRIFHFFIPGGFLLLLGVLFNNAPEIIHWRPVVAKVSLLVVPVFGLVVGWRFNKFKPVLAILALLLAEWAIHNFVRGVDVDQSLAMFVRNSVGVLLPVNLAFLALGRERGLLNMHGGTKIFLVLCQPLAVFFAFQHYPDTFYLLDRGLSFISIPEQFNLSQAGAGAYSIALLIMTVNLVRSRGAVETGFLWSLLASFLGLAVYQGLLSTICFTVASLILVVSIIEAAHTMAFRDELTGLPSRRALNEMFLKLHGQYTVAMLDIDFFKKFNDRYGHDVGDQVLKMVGSRIARVGGGGRYFRYGGEEFTIVFPGRSEEETLPFLERLRQSVETAGFTLRAASRPRRSSKKGRKTKVGATDRRVGVTISIGVAGRDDRRLIPEEVVKKADLALYRAKGGGRNQVAV